MRHTLIPQADRDAIHREYRMRVVALLCAALACAFVVGMAALFPTFLRASTVERAALEEVAADKIAGGAAAAGMQAELGADGKLVTALSASLGDVRLSDVVRQIAGVRSGISLTSVSVQRQDPRTVDVTLAGLAPTRDGLISFENRLKDIAPGTAVDLPYDELAASTNIQFSISLVEKVPASADTP